MADNYFGTALQMMADSQLLHQNSRWHTSCYLAGYVVECGLKAIAEKDGLSPTTLSRHPYGHKFAQLLIYVMAASIVTDLPRGIAFPDIARSTLVAEWNPQKRYDPTWSDNQRTSDSFQKTALELHDYLIESGLNEVSA